MKIPCEVIVWYVVPSIRRELAIELIKSNKISQKKTARLLDITTAAISQYVNDKRGNRIYEYIMDAKTKKLVKTQIATASKEIMRNPNCTVGEICKICNLLKKENVINEFYIVHEKGPIPQNILCFND